MPPLSRASTSAGQIKWNGCILEPKFSTLGTEVEGTGFQTSTILCLPRQPQLNSTIVKQSLGVYLDSVQRDRLPLTRIVLPRIENWNFLSRIITDGPEPCCSIVWVHIFLDANQRKPGQR